MEDIKFNIEYDAVFKGQDGSMGCRYGHKYKVVLTQDAKFTWVKWNPVQLADRLSRWAINSFNKCPYSNLDAVLGNWILMC